MRNLKQGPVAVALASGRRSTLARRVSACLAPLCVTLLLTTTAIGQQAEPLAVTYNLDIPAQSLNDALQALALASQHKLLYSSELVEGKKSQAIRGPFTTEQAVRALLSGSNLAYEVTSDGVVLIRAAGEGASSKRTASGSTSMLMAPAGPWTLRLAEESGSQTHPQSDGGQTGYPSTADAATKATGLKLEEIVVTAQRHEENADKVPLSLMALSQRTMDDLHIQSVADLAAVIPGISFTTQTGSGQDLGDIAIRGIYGGIAGGTAPTTQLYIDETPISIRQLQNAPSGIPLPYIFDLDRVEVLRGPQGTLFGASAMGGAIRFLTPQPNLRTTSGTAKAEAGYTEHGDPSYEVGGAFGTPLISDTLAFRVSAWYQNNGGFIDREDPFTGQILKANANTSDVSVVRAAVSWVPVDGLTITPSLFYQRRKSASPDTYYTNYLANSTATKPAWGGTAEPLSDNLRVPALAITYDLGSALFQSDTSYLSREINVTSDITHDAEAYVDLVNGVPPGVLLRPFIPGADSFVAQSYDTASTAAFQQEFRLTSKDPNARASWVAGAYYRRAEQRLRQLWTPDLSLVTQLVAGLNSFDFFGGVADYNYLGTPLSAYTNERAVDISEALFGDVTVALTSHLKLNLGARLEHSIVKDQYQETAGPVYFGTTTQTLLEQSQNAVTPRASLTYQFTDHDMVYVSAAKGFRPGGGNSSTTINDPICQQGAINAGITIPAGFGSDSLWSYEIGSKDSLFNRRLTIDGSIYYVDWTKIQGQVFLPGCGEPFTVNSAKGVSEGFDLQLAAIITDGLKWGAALGYTHAYVPANGAAVAGAPNFGDVVPRMVATNLEYSRDADSLWSGARGYIRVDYRWTGGKVTPTYTPASPTWDPEIGTHHDGPYSMLNIRAGVVRSGWDVSAYVKNLTNAQPLLGYSHDFIHDPLLYAEALRPRTFGVTAWYRL